MTLDIRLSKIDLAEKIKRRLGYPMVKVELDPTQINDAIDYAKDKYLKWAVGNAKVETFFTLLLSAGEKFYDLPIGVSEVVDVYDGGSQYGINTLFTVENFLYSRGVYDPLIWTGGYSYTLVSYHIARDFLKTVRRYTPSSYNYKYHPYTNQLEVNPSPPSGNSLSVYNESGGTTTIDSPGWVMIRSYMIEGSHYAIETTDPNPNWKRGDSDTNFYVSDWMFDYALAECKIMLGMIRRKFSGFTSIGNEGITLDGDTLVTEGKEEKERLEETLRLEEQYEGYGILQG